MFETEQGRAEISRFAVDLAIRVALIAGVIYASLLLVRPVAAMLLWSVILAVAVFPLFAVLHRRLRLPNTLAAAVLSCAAVDPAGAEDDKTLAPGDNLVVEGLPRIPLSLVEGVARYTESRAAAFLAVTGAFDQRRTVARKCKKRVVHHDFSSRKPTSTHMPLWVADFYWPDGRVGSDQTPSSPVRSPKAAKSRRNAIRQIVG